MILTFGKYKGKPLDEIPADYLSWVLRECRCAKPSLLLEIRRPLEQEDAPSHTAASLAKLNAWHRQLACEFHPDSGGTHDRMKAVNRGRDVWLEIEGLA